MKPLTILVFLALQLYLEHARIEDNVAKMIQTIEENEGLECRCNQQIMEVPK